MSVALVLSAREASENENERLPREQVQALPHAVAAINAFLGFGNTPFWTFSRVCKADILSLAMRFASQEPDDMNTHYRAYLFSEGLMHAVRNGNVAMVQWLCCEYCPSGFAWDGVEEAAGVGNIEMLEWLTTRYEFSEIHPKLLELATENGHLEALKWVSMRYECCQFSQKLVNLAAQKYNYTMSMMLDFASRSRHSEMLHWLVKQIPMLKYPRNAIMVAIDQGDEDFIRSRHYQYREYGWDEFLSQAIKCGDTVMAQLFFDLDDQDYVAIAARLEGLAPESYSSGKPYNRTDHLELAVATGDLDMARLVHSYSRLRRHYTRSGAMRAAAHNGNLHIVQWLHANSVLHHMKWPKPMDAAASQGHFEIVQWMHANTSLSNDCSTDAMDSAAANGHLEIVQWLHANRTEGCTWRALEGAASNNHLDVIQWLHANSRQRRRPKDAVTTAATNGHVRVIQWLHENDFGGFSTRAMDRAAKNNHLDVVKWLHENRSEGCTAKAMDDAAENSHLEVVKWLYEHRHEGCTPYAMARAAKNNHLRMVKWLHKHRSEGCAREAIVWSLRNDNLEMVQWLHKNRIEYVTTARLVDQARSLEMVQWLFGNRGEKVTAHTVNCAVDRGDFAVLLFLHAHCNSEGCTTKTLRLAAKKRRFAIFQWMCETYRDQVDLPSLVDWYSDDPAMAALFRHMGVLAID